MPKKTETTKKTTRLKATEKGIVPETTIEERFPYRVKKLSEEEYAVVKENGDVIRTYTKKEHGTPKELAEMFAKKMSDRWQVTSVTLGKVPTPQKRWPNEK